MTRAASALAKMAEALGLAASGVISDKYNARGARKSDLRHAGPGARPDEFIAVNNFQIEMETLYAAWVASTVAALVAETKEGRDRALILSIALALLLADVEAVFRRRVLEAAELGRGESVREAALLAFALTAVDNSIRKLSAETLPLLRTTFDSLPSEAEADELRAALESPLSRLAALQAGTWWAVYNRGVGERAVALEESVLWRLDPDVKTNHCTSCLDYGDRRYDSFKRMLEITGGIWPAHGTNCDGNCRCRLM